MIIYQAQLNALLCSSEYPDNIFTTLMHHHKAIWMEPAEQAI